MFRPTESTEGPASLIKYEPPLDISQKLEAYRQANYLPTHSDSRPSHEDILNIILPPREWVHHGQTFLQYVSHSQPEREDVELVKKKLEQSLLLLQARVQGICPIKEQIISQATDEIIRQVTLNSPERGLALMRVRDQRKMTIAAYQTVYEEGVAYGVRKQCRAQQGMDELEGQLKALEFKEERLLGRREQLLSKKESMQQKFRERRVVQTEKMEYEHNVLKSQNEHLESFLSKYRHLNVEVEQPQGEDENED